MLCLSTGKKEEKGEKARKSISAFEQIFLNHALSKDVAFSARQCHKSWEIVKLPDFL